MKRIYNKGRYRFGEYGHLRPYLKRQGNKRWRKATKEEVHEQLNEFNKHYNFKKKKGKKKKIVLKITKMHYGHHKYSETRRYERMRDAQNAIRRNCVIGYHFVKDPA